MRPHQRRWSSRAGSCRARARDVWSLRGDFRGRSSYVDVVRSLPRPALDAVRGYVLDDRHRHRLHSFRVAIVTRWSVRRRRDCCLDAGNLQCGRGVPQLFEAPRPVNLGRQRLQPCGGRRPGSLPAGLRVTAPMQELRGLERRRRWYRRRLWSRHGYAYWNGWRREWHAGSERWSQPPASARRCLRRSYTRRHCWNSRL